MEVIINAYFDLWMNYANFSGRTNVPGYWWAVLADLVIGWILGFIPFVGTVYGLAVIVPSIAITIRRLRDAGRHWAWIFLSLIPLLGQIALIIMLCQPSAGPELLDESL